MGGTDGAPNNGDSSTKKDWLAYNPQETEAMAPKTRVEFAHHQSTNYAELQRKQGGE